LTGSLRTTMRIKIGRPRSLLELSHLRPQNGKLTTPSVLLLGVFALMASFAMHRFTESSIRTVTSSVVFPAYNSRAGQLHEGTSADATWQLGELKERCQTSVCPDSSLTAGGVLRTGRTLQLCHPGSSE
jgi:hypothetical protein